MNRDDSVGRGGGVGRSVHAMAFPRFIGLTLDNVCVKKVKKENF